MNTPGPSSLGGTGPSGPAARGLFGRSLLYVVVLSLQTVAAVVVSPMLAYLLGPTEFGSLATAIALHQALIVLAVLGLDQGLVLQRAADKDSRAARGLVAVGIALSMAVTFGIGVTGPLWSRSLGFGGFSSLLIATVLWTAPGAIVQLTLAELLTEDRLVPFAAVSVLSAVGGQVFGIALLFSVARTASAYAWGGVISQSSAMVVALICTRPRLAGLRDRAVTTRAFRIGIPMAFSGAAFFVLNAGDRIIVQRDLGAFQVGRYQVAYTVGWVVVLLVIFTSQAWTPRFAAVQDEAERWVLLGQSRDELYRLLIPVTLGITLAAPVALRLVAPPTFEPASLLIVVYLVAVSAFPIAAGGASDRALITMRRAKPLAVVAGVAAATNIALNIVLVPVMGIAGAALATVAAFALQAFLQLRALPKHRTWPGSAGAAGRVRPGRVRAERRFGAHTADCDVRRRETAGRVRVPAVVHRPAADRARGSRPPQAGTPFAGSAARSRPDPRRARGCARRDWSSREPGSTADASCRHRSRRTTSRAGRRRPLRAGMGRGTTPRYPSPRHRGRPHQRQ